METYIQYTHLKWTPTYVQHTHMLWKPTYSTPICSGNIHTVGTHVVEWREEGFMYGRCLQNVNTSLSWYESHRTFLHAFNVQTHDVILEREINVCTVVDKLYTTTARNVSR